MKYNFVWLVFVLPACGAVAVGPSGGPDAGVVPAVDAGAPVDRGVALPIDAGVVTPGDVGVTRDAGFPVFPDAGFPFDRGVPTDNNVPFPRDTGFFIDRGAPRDDGFRADVATPTRAAVVAGRRCRDDESCFGSAADLSCIPTPGGSVCTGPEGCEQGTTAEEERQCGGRFSTCLIFGAVAVGESVSLCTRACVPGARTEATGACAAGSLCTTNWVQLRAGVTESPGCLAFCTADADCAGGDPSIARCNTRLGRCGPAPSNPMLRPDGALCVPNAGGSGVEQCRGVCFQISATRPEQGICGSFINTRVNPACADDPSMTPRQPAGDDLGICIFRDCETNADCADGAACVFPEDESGVRRDALPYCAYRTALQPNGIVAP